jgi:hypothetical protein
MSPSEERLKRLWLQCTAATDSDEVESLLMQFRDALHEHIDQVREESKGTRRQVKLATKSAWSATIGHGKTCFASCEMVEHHSGHRRVRVL